MSHTCGARRVAPCAWRSASRLDGQRDLSARDLAEPRAEDARPLPGAPALGHDREVPDLAGLGVRGRDERLGGDELERLGVQVGEGVEVDHLVLVAVGADRALNDEGVGVEDESDSGDLDAVHDSPLLVLVDRPL